jgi:hypothetical protein
MPLTAQDLVDNVVSVAQASGLFDRVNAYEPKQAPGNGLTASVWVQSIAPHAQVSGLDVTSARVEFTMRLYTNMLADPEETIDPNLMNATSQMMNLFTGDFTLGNSVFAVDLLGMAGVPLTARAGYVDVGGKLFRIMDITVPLIVADVWTQVA